MRTERQQSFFDQESDSYILKNGFPEDKRLWSLNQRESYIRHMAAFIEQNPNIFGTEDVEHARNVKNIDLGSEIPNNLGTMISEFFTESTAQIQRINPFSEMNKNLLWIVGGLAVVTVTAVIAFKLTPNISAKK